MMKNIICIISGPTASGKTSTSIELAKTFGGEIVNFDSLLFYRELNVGTAKPTKEEMQNIIHHQIDTHSAGNPINAADYIRSTIPLINHLHQQNKIVYLVGGSGFYLQALLYGMFDSVTTPENILKKSDELYQTQGIDPFLKILKEKDTKSFEQYHENDHYRIRRAVEHYWTSNTAFSDSRHSMESKKQNGPMLEFKWQVFHAYLDLPKDLHWEIIQKRTRKMLDDGLVKEMQLLLENGLSGQEKPLLSIGYKETQDYLNGKIETLSDLEERISISTRQLAKSQRTWFKKQNKKTYNPISEKELLKEDFHNFLKSL